MKKEPEEKVAVNPRELLAPIALALDYQVTELKKLAQELLRLAKHLEKQSQS